MAVSRNGMSCSKTESPAAPHAPCRDLAASKVGTTTTFPMLRAQFAGVSSTMTVPLRVKPRARRPGDCHTFRKGFVETLSERPHRSTYFETHLSPLHTNAHGRCLP